MTVAYPELNVGTNLPLFGYQKRKCEEHTRREDAKSSVDDLKKNLQDSIEIEGWGEDIPVNMESEEKCLEMLKKLEDAINCHRRKITYLSCLQGQVMERLRDLTDDYVTQNNTIFTTVRIFFNSLIRLL